MTIGGGFAGGLQVGEGVDAVLFGGDDQRGDAAQLRPPSSWPATRCWARREAAIDSGTRESPSCHIENIGQSAAAGSGADLTLAGAHAAQRSGSGTALTGADAADDETVQ